MHQNRLRLRLRWWSSHAELPGKLLLGFQKFLFHQMPRTRLKCAKLFDGWDSASEPIRRAI